MTKRRFAGVIQLGTVLGSPALVLLLLLESRKSFEDEDGPVGWRAASGQVK